MATLKTKYGTEAQAITITLASLANGNARESTIVDNTTDLFLDVLVQLKIESQAGTPGSDKRIYVYAYGTTDIATPLYPDAVTGSNAAITLNDPTQLRLIGIIEVSVSAQVCKSEPMSVAQAFGGIMPEKWGIVVQNKTNMTFHATEGNHKKVYQGVYAQSV